MISDLLPSQGLFELVRHLSDFHERRREAIARRFRLASTEPEDIAVFWVRNPEVVLEVTRRELRSASAWRTFEEVVLNHDDGTLLDWAPASHVRAMQRLGFIREERDENDFVWSIMPGLLASIFAGHVQGERGSLPILLGRSSLDEVQALCDIWGLPTLGAKAELIGVVIEHFRRQEMVEDILEALPNPDWIGDALMVLELGGLCFWQQIYGYDLEAAGGGGDNVVPLMRSAERKHQQEVAQELLERGVIFRLESEQEGDYTMIAVPEELWRGLWELGQMWLSEWVNQSVTAMAEEGGGQPWRQPRVDLRGVLKWFVFEAEGGRLQANKKGVTEESRSRLAPILDENVEQRWDEWWALALELGIFEQNRQGELSPGRDKLEQLDLRSSEFRREVLAQWCTNSLGRGADRRLNEAIGLDEEWRRLAWQHLRETRRELPPSWMLSRGVEQGTTGGGWLRDPERGTAELLEFEMGLTFSFVVLTKLSWLDVLSLLPGDRSYPVESLVELLQCVAALSMFSQLGVVLRSHPIAAYLPFQRASHMMDELQGSAFRDWVDDIIDFLLIPLGVAERSEGGERVLLETQVLRIESPPGWPEGGREELMAELFGEDVEFEIPRHRETELRAVEPSWNGEDGRYSIDGPLEELLEIIGDGEVLSFDGKYLKVGERG